MLLSDKAILTSVEASPLVTLFLAHKARAGRLAVTRAFVVRLDRDPHVENTRLPRRKSLRACTKACRMSVVRLTGCVFVARGHAARDQVVLRDGAQAPIHGRGRCFDV